MKKILILLIIIYCSGTSLGTSLDLYKWKEVFTSNKYSYSITIPKSFKKSSATGKNIDLKFTDDYGASIIINVTQRLPEEYNITAHDYSKEFIEDIMKQATPNFTIHYSEKIYVDGEKAFLYISTGGVSSKLKDIYCTLYKDDLTFVLSASAPKDKFNDYRQLFETAIKSLKFN